MTSFMWLKKRTVSVRKIEEEAILTNMFYETRGNLIPKPDKHGTKEENYRPITFIDIETNI